MPLPNKKPTPLWPRKVLFFVFRCFTAPPKIVDEIREVFRRFLHVETEPKFHWFGLRNDACGTSRRPVDGGEEVLPKKPIGVIGLIDIVIVVAPSSNIFFKNRKHIGCAFFMRPVSNRLDRSTKLYGGGSFGSWGFDDKCWCFCLLPFWRYFIFLKKRWPMVQIDWWGCYHDKINPDI